MKTLGIINPTQDIRTYADSVGAAVLVAATAQAIDIASGAHYLSIAADAPFWIRFGSTTVAIPGASSTATSTLSEYVPTTAMPYSRNIGSTLLTTGFSIVAATTGLVSYQFYT